MKKKLEMLEAYSRLHACYISVIFQLEIFVDDYGDKLVFINFKQPE